MGSCMGSEDLLLGGKARTPVNCFKTLSKTMKQGVRGLMLSRFLQIDGYRIVDQSFSAERSFLELRVEPVQEMACWKCGSVLGTSRSRHRMRVEDLPVMTYRNYIVFFRRKGMCPTCKKFRSERVEFLSDESPHLTKQYVW